MLKKSANFPQSICKCANFFLSSKYYMENKKSRFESSIFTEEIITENDLPSYLLSLESQALSHIQNQDLQSALSSLKTSEEMMESISMQGGSLNSENIISILHNIAYCYQE